MRVESPPAGTATPLTGLVVVGLEQAVSGPFCTRSLADLGCQVLLEIGPDPVLCSLATANWQPPVTGPGWYLVIEKWASREAQRAHFDSAEMVEMAEACKGILAAPPDIDLYDGVSAHDLA